MPDMGNYADHAKYWDWSGHDRTDEHVYWLNYAKNYGRNVLIPMCALAETGAYMAERGLNVYAFDLTPEMIDEGIKRYGNTDNLHYFQGDVTNFHFDIPPIDFCFSMDFGHLPTLEDVQKALRCINRQLRPGGALVIETTLPPTESSTYEGRTFMPKEQVYPGLRVWKTTSGGRFDADTGRHYINQTFHAQDETGHVEHFDHAFYLQSYPRVAWHDAFDKAGFDIIKECNDRDSKTWQSGDGELIIEAVKRG